jgi:hypothetical protein
VTDGMTGTRWLILSYFSRIDGMACAQHIDDRIEHLRARGVEPLMLTGVCGERWRGLVHKRALSASPSGLRFELRHLKKRGGMTKLWAGLLNLLILPLYLLEKLVIDLDSQWSWFPFAILQGQRMCSRYRPQLIYSTGGPASAHLAAAMIANRHNIPWIAEFQDPLVHDDWLRSKRALKVFTWLERLICTRADAVIFLTDQARRNADRRTGLTKRGWTVYPGADPVAMPDVAYKQGNECTFAHFGSLGGSRNLNIFLEGLRRVISERPELTEIIRLDIYGTCDRLSRRAIDEFPWPRIIRNHGRVPRHNSLEAMKKTDILLLIQNTEEFSTETIPSKTYEYLHIGRPILGLVHKNPELSEMMLRLGHMPVKADSPEDIKRSIAELAESWIEGRLHPSSGGGFTVAQAVDRLITIQRGTMVQRKTGTAGTLPPVNTEMNCD